MCLAVVLLLQLYFLVPRWLFYSVLAGWIAYVAVAAIAATGHEIAYPPAFILACLTLAVSLPQPEHYSFASEGMWLASFTFVAGSALQLLLLILVPIFMVKKRRETAREEGS